MLISTFYGCQSEEEKREKEIVEQTNRTLAKALAKLQVREYIDTKEYSEIIAKAASITNDSAELGYKYAMYWDSISKLPPEALKSGLTDEIKPEEPEVSNAQELFINAKVESFKNYIADEPSIDKGSPTINSYKKEASTITRDFFSENNSKIENWTAEVIWVDMWQDNECDIALAILPRTLVGSKNVGGIRTFDCGITIDASQSTSKKLGTKGIKRSGELYNKVKVLKEGDKVVFSAKVLKFDDTSEKTGLNLSVSLYIELTEISKN